MTLYVAVKDLFVSIYSVSLYVRVRKQSECYVAKYSLNYSRTASLCALVSPRLLLDVTQDFETKVFDV